jgi:hypothetical protein
MNPAPKCARKATILAALLIAASLPASSHVTLESATVDEAGGSVQSGPITLLTTAGQSLIGAVRSQLVSLETGFIYSIGGRGNGRLKAHLTFPRGQCAVSDGRSLTITGTVGGSQLQSWMLEAASGKQASSGFQTLASGGAEVSDSSLGAWSTAGLSGWQTIRLTAVDQSTGAAVNTAEVFLGDPEDAFNSGPMKSVWPEVAKHLVKPCDK